LPKPVEVWVSPSSPLIDLWLGLPLNGVETSLVDWKYSTFRTTLGSKVSSRVVDK